MPHTPGEPSQLAPSQFAYFKTIQPSTTDSGVIPGRALLDTPSPHRSPSPFLERSQRNRKPTARKVQGQASQAQPSTSKSKAKKPSASTRNGKDARNSSNANTSKSAAFAESQVDNIGMATQSGADVANTDAQGGYNSQGEEEYEDEDGSLQIDPTIVEQLEALLGHSVEHLSDRQLKSLLDKVCETQALAMDTQVKPPTAVAQSLAGVGLASRDRDVSPSHAGSGEYSSSQTPRTIASNKGSLNQQKRRLDTATTGAVSKRPRVAAEEGNSATESESHSDSDARRPTLSSSDSDSEPEVIAPFLRPPPKPQKAAPTIPLPKPTPPIRTSTLAPREPPINTYLARHPPPNDINDNEALINWARKIVEEQKQTFDSSSGSSNPGPSGLQRPNPPSTTAHVTQAIANHRAERAATEHHPESQATINAPNSHTSASTPATDRAATLSSGGGKKKYHRKTKLADFPGHIGEIASAAIPYFLSTVFAEGGYENLETFQDWALDAYHRTWDLEYPEERDEYEPPPIAVLKVMTRRASWLRGEIKKRIRAVAEYGYGFRHPAVCRADIKHNRRLAKKLKPHVFHCKDLVPDTDQFEHPEFIRAIGAGLFWDSESLGAVFQDRFKPVPLPAVALILTMLQVCIEEWHSGHYKSTELDVDTQQKVYERHLLSLYAYEKIAATRLTRFRREWAAAGLDYSGAALNQISTAAQPYVLASNIRPDTPPLELTTDE